MFSRRHFLKWAKNFTSPHPIWVCLFPAGPEGVRISPPILCFRLARLAGNLPKTYQPCTTCCEVNCLLL